jgi:hypothetical protein
MVSREDPSIGVAEELLFAGIGFGVHPLPVAADPWVWVVTEMIG